MFISIGDIHTDKSQLSHALQTWDILSLNAGEGESLAVGAHQAHLHGCPGQMHCVTNTNSWFSASLPFRSSTTTSPCIAWDAGSERR